MATCKWCNKSGFFLKVSSNGLCLNCNQPIVNSVRFNAGKIKEALDDLEYYDRMETAIKNFKEILEHAKPLVAYENKGIKTIDPLPSVLINAYTEKLNWIKDLREKGFKIYRNFNSRVAGVTYPNEDGSSRQDIIEGCNVGDKLFPITAPFGKFKTATKLITKDNKQIGWLTHTVAEEFYNLINDSNYKFDIEINEVTGGGYDKPEKGCNIRFTCFQKQNHKKKRE